MSAQAPLPRHAVAAQAYALGWRPRLTPTQRVLYDDHDAAYILCHGERAGGKTVGALHKLVRHCFLNENAFACIIVREVGQSREGGAWDKLVDMVLPEWKTGLGLHYTTPEHDRETKKPFIWIENRFGSGSKVSCISMPVAGHVGDKIKGREFSFVLVDEAQTTFSDEYFTSIVQQVGRRLAVEDVQCVVYCANPKGPSHWLYKRFFVIPFDEQTREKDPAYALYHFPISENINNLPAGYYDRVIEATRGDPVEQARMVRGEWVDRPTGQAVFAHCYSEQMHVKGDAIKGQGILPHPAFVIMVGYDLGPVHTSIHFLQRITTSDKTVWVVFDEIPLVARQVPYRQVAAMVMGRMDYWNKVCKKEMTYDHISDDSAFNQIRGDGSVDALLFQNESKGRIRMRAAPKGKGSVAERVRLVTELLQQEELLISATCMRTRQMFRLLDYAPGSANTGETASKPRKGPEVHVFDSLSYPILAVQVGRAFVGWTVGKAAPALVAFG
jgi:hypothetical protein